MVTFLTTGGLFLFVLSFAGFATYLERKISADFQLRIGPNRVGPIGLLQILADGLKLITKQVFIPTSAEKIPFLLAPLLAVSMVFATLSFIPFLPIPFTNSIHVGLLYILAFISFVSFAVFLAGHSSGSTWSFLGSARAIAQILSYEIPLVITLMGLTVISSGLSVSELLERQGVFPHEWLIFYNPFTFCSFFIFFLCGLAQSHRAPFDLPEAESELVSGYHTEYSGVAFGLFGIAEYTEVFVFCALGAFCFLGGTHHDFNVEGALSLAVGLTLLMIKISFLFFCVFWFRWTLPRMRMDQLMYLCWYYLLPISLFNVVGIFLWEYFSQSHSFWELVF